MRFSAPLTALFLAMTVQAGVAQSEGPVALAERSDDVDTLEAAVEKREGISLEKKACTYNGCKCNSRGKQLTVCGNCYWSDTGAWVVTTKRVSNQIYECSPTGNCCTYGVGSDCGKAGARCIKN
ncbi:mold-specific m46 protein [Colletotrichum kahawae]|uniref:Mold-specific m46 protein n=1 Tax=Colletotrichum kahawae TaxID=34407 RepID=A0AAD9Y4Y6_COLKA|nr:mold-specific m46 protein [Colletotrichum kahawae]